MKLPLFPSLRYLGLSGLIVLAVLAIAYFAPNRIEKSRSSGADGISRRLLGNATIRESDPKDTDLLDRLLLAYSKNGDGAARDYIKALRAEEFPRLLSELTRISDREKGNRLINLIFEDWALRDPAEAITQAVSYSAEQVLIVLRQWTQKDAPAAWAWVADKVLPTELLLGKGQIDYYGQITDTLLSDGRRTEAERLTDAIPIEIIKSSVTAKYLGQLASKDPQAAIDWLQHHEFQDKGSSDLATRALGHGIASWGVEEAMVILDRISDESLRSLIISGMTIEWSGKRDISSLNRLVEHLNISSPAEADSMLFTIGLISRLSDPSAALSAISRIVSTTMRDSALDGLAAQVAKTKPDLAWKAALKIQDTDRQQRALERVIRTWTVSDPVAARSAIGEISSAELRQKLQ